MQRPYRRTPLLPPAKGVADAPQDLLPHKPSRPTAEAAETAAREADGAEHAELGDGREEQLLLGLGCNSIYIFDFGRKTGHKTGPCSGPNSVLGH